MSIILLIAHSAISKQRADKLRIGGVNRSVLTSAVSGSVPNLLLSFPECGGEECHDCEDLQPPEEHTDNKNEAA